MTDPKDNLPEADKEGFGIPAKEPTPEPDYFSDDEPITEADISPSDPDEEEA